MRGYFVERRRTPIRWIETGNLTAAQAGCGGLS